VEREATPFSPVGKLTKEPAEYIIHFHDSRISTARVPLIEGLSFRDRVRAAILRRVAKISGPLELIVIQAIGLVHGPQLRHEPSERRPSLPVERQSANSRGQSCDAFYPRSSRIA